MFINKGKNSRQGEKDVITNGYSLAMDSLHSTLEIVSEWRFSRLYDNVSRLHKEKQNDF